jgi:hypothetical protein
MDEYEAENSAESEDRDYLDGVSKLMSPEWESEEDEMAYCDL